ncbi:hypothetical protein RND81_05G263300 [Saponaria officinalis]|uniref:Uncharacterized protein n=1 Tax=Saponaria officinalis TaxID=3572 RepID=A0AAW1L268_SAPOF
MGSISNEYSALSQHISVLQKVVVGRSAEETIIRSYKRSFNGFAARLKVKEYENLKSLKEVVSVFPSRMLQLQTTRSWDYLGLPQPTPEQLNAESDVIIGVIDSGIWPKSPSFDDSGLSPVPKKWKGVCEGGPNFNCNKKIIGARGYLGSAWDGTGHGSHTASTAAGQKVEGASFYGIAKGSARGGVPSARIAVYAVCNSIGCKGTDILAAFDDAIADGVDLITISIGGRARDLYNDVVAIGAFHAMVKGVLTVQSAGNDGDSRSTVGSVAPWVLTVAANTMDRHIITKVVLEDGKTLIGNSVNAFKLEGEYPLVYGKDVTSKCNENDAKSCSEGCLDKSLVKKKITVCNNTLPYATALRAGAIGVLAVSSVDAFSFITPLPAAPLNDSSFAALISYLNSTKAPKAKILKSEAVNDTSAPIVAHFSSRGPNSIASDILKPDISAPGVDILAAYSPLAPISEYGDDTRSVTYNVLSGTSMACPHVAGAAAYLKSVHPDWSPATIKSALMTTADEMSPSKNKDAELSYGSGHLNPLKARNPGLIYEATENDYITFLCKFGYDQKNLSLITGKGSVICPKPDQSPKDVNYPSLSTKVGANKSFTVKFSRTLTNVGTLNSTYNAKVISGSELAVTVQPNSLFFKSFKESKSFDVTVVGKGIEPGSFVSASLVWSDGFHRVRSPIVVYTS